MNQEDTKQDISLAILSRDIHHMSVSLAEIKTQFNTVMGNYVTRAELSATVEAQTKLHDDIEKRIRAREEKDGIFEAKMAKISTEIKIWLTVGGFIIGAVEAVVLAIILKAL